MNYLKWILDRPCIIFAVIALFFGSFMLFLTPPNEVPDEPDHVMRTCEIADGIFYSKTPIEYTNYDKYLKIHKSSKNEEIFGYNPDEIIRYSDKFHFAGRNSAILYAMPALGLKIGSLFTKNYNILFHLCRFLNLLLYVALVSMSIFITPVFKYPFLFVGLVPMALFEGMSFSADSFHNGFAFLFFAFVFKLLYVKKETTGKDFSLLSIFSVIGAFCKSLLYPVSLFLFLPKFDEKLQKKLKFNRWLFVFGLMFLTVIICYIWISINYKNLNLEYEVIQNPMIIFQDPFGIMYKMYYTVCHHYKDYLREFIGILGWLHIYLNPEAYIIGLAGFVSTLILLPEKIKLSHKIMAILSFIGFSGIIFYTHILYWDNPQTPEIEGIQGRYFISLAPLLFVSFANSRIKLKEKYMYIYKIILVLVIIGILINACVRLNEFYNIYHMNRHLIDAYLKGVL